MVGSAGRRCRFQSGSWPRYAPGTRPVGTGEGGRAPACWSSSVAVTPWSTYGLTTIRTRSLSWAGYSPRAHPAVQPPGPGHPARPHWGPRGRGRRSTHRTRTPGGSGRTAGGAVRLGGSGESGGAAGARPDRPDRAGPAAPGHPTRSRAPCRRFPSRRLRFLPPGPDPEGPRAAPPVPVRARRSANGSRQPR